MAEQEPPQIRLDELTQRELPDGAEELPPLQRVGYRLSLVVFSSIAVATVIILLISFVVTPPIHPPGRLHYFDDASVANYQRAVELYKQIGDPQLERATTLFQQIVITALLPSFAAILGYIFGSKQGR